MKILAIYGSSRDNGNNEQLAEIVLNGLNAEKVHLRDYHIQAIVDGRHTEEGFCKVEDDYEDIINKVIDHEILLFVTPIYWYGMSGIMKNFIDRWSQILRDSRYTFKETMAKKHAYVIAVGGNQPKIKGLPLIQQFNYIFGFMNMPFNGYILGQGSKPGEIMNDTTALKQAELLNQELKKLTIKKETF